MNWTGGRLQQSRRSGAAVNAKQRAHFARARARLQNGSVPPSPPRFAILEEYQPGYRTSLAEPNCHIASALARGPQRKLGEYPNIAPSVRILAPMGSRHYSIRRSPRSRRQSHRPVSNNLEAKRAMKHGDCLPIATADDEAWLQAKRLELLERPNWLTAPAAKPLKITFTSFEERQMIGRRRKLDENPAQHHAKRTRTIGHKDDLVVSHRLPTHRASLYPEDVASDAVSVRIGTSIHGSQRTGLLPSSKDDHVSHLDSTSEQLNANSAHATLSINELLENDADASSSVFEPLESIADSSSSLFEPLEFTTDASLSVIEIPNDGVGYTSQSIDQRDELHRLVPLSIPHSSDGSYRAATVVTRRPPRNVQYNVPIYQHQKRTEDIMSPGSSHDHARQRNGRLIFPTSPLRMQATNNVTLAASTDSIPASDHSISAQASEDEGNIEANSNEEEWRGFVDIGFTSDDMFSTGNLSSDVLETTTKATISDPTESGERSGLFEDQSSSQPMLDSSYSCSDHTQCGSPAQARDTNDGVSLSGSFSGTFLTQASPKLVSSYRPIEPSIATGEDTLEDKVGKYPQTIEQEVEEDPDSVWYHFVFGHDKEVDENGEKEEQERLRRDSPVDSLVVEASEPLSAKQSSTSAPIGLGTAVSSSPDPLSLPVGKQAHQPKQPKVIFRKPVRFDGSKPRVDTVRIGQNLRSSSPLDLRPGDKWRQLRAVRRRQSEMTWPPPDFENSEDIEDEEDD
ncbi:hypothetical protein MMC17_004940 [Xylographa soralifera]|nr:hypothetical protein [Xylographa soralifera]